MKKSFYVKQPRVKRQKAHEHYCTTCKTYIRHEDEGCKARTVHSCRYCRIGGILDRHNTMREQRGYRPLAHPRSDK